MGVSKTFWKATVVRRARKERVVKAIASEKMDRRRTSLRCYKVFYSLSRLNFEGLEGSVEGLTDKSYQGI